MTALTITEFQQLIIDRLSAVLPAITIDKCPFDPAILGEPVTEQAIWVGLDGINSQEPEGGAVYREHWRQSENWRFVLVLRIFDLYYADGQLDILETIRSALTGVGSVQADSARGLWHQATTPGQFAEGLWLYQSIWQIDRHYTQTFDI
jgi:Gp37 protein